MQENLVPDMSARRRWLAGVLADRSFHGVLLIWALCCLGMLLCIVKFGLSLPFTDEWELLTRIACGQESLSWRWLWVAANEHRMPLTRLSVFVVGRLSHWNWQAMHNVNLAFMGMGALALLCAARSVRGRSSLSDAFLCLIVLTPYHLQTMWQYGYAYAMAGGLTCLAVSLITVRQPQRSLLQLVVFLIVVMAVTLAGGPPGNLLALGLSAALLTNLAHPHSRAWKLSACAGAGLIALVSLVLLASIPAAPQHANFMSDSPATTLKATSRESVCWLGSPVLSVIWPWAFLVVLIPGLWVGSRVVRDLWGRQRDGGQTVNEWADLSLVLLSALLVAAAIAYGRARLSLWDSRYVVLTMPIGIVLYLLLVRMRAPLAFPQTLAMIMAVCYGWCWPGVLDQQKGSRVQATEFVQALAKGREPLSDLAQRYYQVVNYYPVPLIDGLIQLRENNISIFHTINRHKRRAGLALPQAWKANRGRFSDDSKIVDDENATQNRALYIPATSAYPGQVIYRVQVDVSGAYRLCCRLRSPKEQTLTVVVDGKQLKPQILPPAPEYRPCLVAAPLDLEPGSHDLALSFSAGDATLDLLELLPQ